MHIPVLKKEVLDIFNPKPGQNFIDCTIGFGGHSLEILNRISPGGKLLGIDQDKDAISHLAALNNERLTLVNNNFANLKEVAKENGIEKVNGILFDLGVSSWQLDRASRGFSFLKEEPLVMRLDGNVNALTAKDVVNDYSRNDLERIIKEYGEEKYAAKIAKKIVDLRSNHSIETTLDLVEIIRRAVPERYFNQKIHFATRTFQAIRIEVNKELENLKEALVEAIELLQKDGKLIVISFHSLEDRIVKNFFKERKDIKVLTKKPVIPDLQEVTQNRRARSAKLRAAEKI